MNDLNQDIMSFSSYQLNDAEKLLLGKVLNFALPPRIFNFADCFLPLKMVYRDKKTMDVPSNDLQIIKEALKEHAESSFKK